MTIAIEFKQVTKRYPLYHHLGSGIKELIFKPSKAIKLLQRYSHLAIEDVSFQVNKGEAVALIGRNGAGKSTTLALIAGVIKPSAGTVHVVGRVTLMLELGSGFHHELTGRENICLNATLLGLRRRDVKQRLDKIIEFSELGDFIDEPIRIYSSGMLAKLGFAIITQVEPDILIIDEVLAVGDIAFQRKCLTTIEAFKKKGVTIIFVSHNLDDVQKICDKAIWIEQHKMKTMGSVEELIMLYQDAMA